MIIREKSVCACVYVCVYGLGGMKIVEKMKLKKNTYTKNKTKYTKDSDISERERE